MRCLACGKTIEENSTSCPFCKAQIEDGDEESMYQSFSEYDSFDYTVSFTRIRTGEVVIVKEFPSVLGRSSRCDIVIKDNPAIGRVHLEINRVGENVFVKDLKSKNHTYVNDEIITDIRVIHGDEKLRLADEEFIIEIETD